MRESTGGWHGEWGRDLVLWVARRQAGLTLRELGLAAGGMDYSAVANAILRLPARAQREPSLQRAMRRLESQL